VRKLLVASQKGGVGKTTTSLNLAAAAVQAGTRVLLLDSDPLSSISGAINLTAHPRRRVFRQAGLDLPGAVVCDVIPGLDVLSPYDEGRCDDDDFDHLVALLCSPAVEERYGCLVVDAPPFLGANPGQLVRACDEYVLVMRAEPMAYRTLPAFLELIQRNRTAEHNIQMRGILLTLGEGEPAGDRCERELRGRFGARILPHAIPFEEEVSQEALFGRIVTHSNPASRVSREYAAVVAHLKLAEKKTGAIEASPLLSLLASVASTRRVAAGSGVRRAVAAGGTALLDHGDDGDTADDIPSLDDVLATTPVESDIDLDEAPAEPIRPTRPIRPSQPATKSGVKRRPAPEPAGGLSLVATVVLLVVAIGVGIGLGLPRQSTALLPVFVGASVSVAVLVGLWLVSLVEGKPAPREDRRSKRGKRREE